jgi:AcrR family transcriptional regulator
MMNGESGRQTDPQHLREMIVRAAISLIPEWDTVTTAQIARASGIDEPALLDVFADKNAVLLALPDLIMAALDPARVVQDLQAIPLDQPVAGRLIEAVDALDAYHGRAAAVLAPPDGSDAPPLRLPAGGDPAGETRTADPYRDDFRSAARLDVICDAVADLLAPDQANLRYPGPMLADAFIGLYSGGRQNPQPAAALLSAEQLVELFLHGAVRGAARD